jgi:hypothetical protein
MGAPPPPADTMAPALQLMSREIMGRDGRAQCAATG